MYIASNRGGKKLKSNEAVFSQRKLALTIYFQKLVRNLAPQWLWPVQCTRSAQLSRAKKELMKNNACFDFAGWQWWLYWWPPWWFWRRTLWLCQWWEPRGGLTRWMANTVITIIIFVTTIIIRVLIWIKMLGLINFISFVNYPPSCQKRFICPRSGCA